MNRAQSVEPPRQRRQDEEEQHQPAATDAAPEGEGSLGDMNRFVQAHTEKFKKEIGHLERLNHWPRKVSTTASSRTRMMMGSQNSTPLRSFSTRLSNERFCPQSITLAAERSVIRCAGEISSRDDSLASGCAANFKAMGGSA